MDIFQKIVCIWLAYFTMLMPLNMYMGLIYV